MRNSDGSIVQDGMSRALGIDSEHDDAESYAPYPIRCQVQVIYPIDHPNNLRKNVVECRVVRIDTGKVIDNVPIYGGFDGLEDFSEYIPQSNTRDLRGSTLTEKTPPQFTDGDYCIVMFINGNIRDPYIDKFIPHPSRQGRSLKASMADGRKLTIARMNGTQVYIDKNGNLTIENLDTDAKRNPVVQLPKIFKIKNKDKDGKTNELSIDMTPGAEKISLSDKSGDSILIDAVAQSITVTSKKDQIQTAGGNWTVNVSGDAKVVAKGSGTIQCEQLILDGSGGAGELQQVLTTPQAISDFTGLPIQVGSTTVKASI